MTTAAHLLPSHAANFPPLMMFPSVLIGTMLLAYFIGSIPFGLILAKLYKVGDLRQIGSGNIGATNMLRAGGSKLAIATLVLDMGKGFLAVIWCGALLTALLKDKFTAVNGIKLDIHQFYYFLGLYAVIGHVWPVWLKYKGGKGVATAFGVLLAFDPVVGMLVIAAWLAVFALTQYSSLSALAGIAVAPVLCYAFSTKAAVVSSLLIAFIVLYRHKENIARLMAGTEPKSKLKKE